MSKGKQLVYFMRSFVIKLSILFLLLVSCSRSPVGVNRMVSSGGESYLDGLSQNASEFANTCDHDHDALEVSSFRESEYVPRVKHQGPVRALASSSELYPLLNDNRCSDLTRDELDKIAEGIQHFGGTIVDPRDYTFDLDGFQRYLDDTGVSERFSAREMLAAHRPGDAAACGLPSNLMPAPCRWPSGAIQGMLASQLRAVINNGNMNGPNGIRLRNWYRPECYNRRVGGAGQSDHVQARGFDLDFSNTQHRLTAQRYLCQLYKETSLSLQVGIGCNTLHVGVGSPKRIQSYPQDGTRYWTYASLYNSCSRVRATDDDCWVIGTNGVRYIHPAPVKSRSRTRPNL
jgi:hypothetical protein